MNDKRTITEDEYQYPNEEYVVESKAEEIKESLEKQPSALKRFISNNQRPLFIVVLAVIAIISFQVMKHMKNNRVISDVKTTHTVITPSKPVVSIAPPDMVQQSLENIRQTGMANSQSIAEVNGQLANLQGQLDQTKKTNQQLQQAMVLLLEELKTINENMQNQPKAVKPSGPPKPKITYHVRAIIDGRAWLLSSDGLAESVTVGDPIPGYGLVKAIDPNRGLIYTSSDKTIGYGLNDF